MRSFGINFFEYYFGKLLYLMMMNIFQTGIYIGTFKLSLQLFKKDHNYEFSTLPLFFMLFLRNIAFCGITFVLIKLYNCKYYQTNKFGLHYFMFCLLIVGILNSILKHFLGVDTITYLFDFSTF